MRNSDIYPIFTSLLLLYRTASIQGDVIRITPSGPLTVVSGSTLHFNCTVSITDIRPNTIKWDYGRRDKAEVQKIDENTLQLTLTNIDESDSGHIACKGENKFGHIRYKRVKIRVVPDAVVTSCSSSRTQYRCSSGECIFLQFRCDNVINCKDASDEEGCDKSCSDGFLCDNGRCIDSALVCDKFHTNNCGDWSDEVCRVQSAIRPGGADRHGKTRKQKDQDWIPMTVYIIVGCVIALAIIVAILVITAFKLRLKHNLARRYHQTPQLVAHEHQPSPYVQRLAAYDAESGVSDDESIRGQQLRPFIDDPNMPQGESPPPPYAMVETARINRVRDTDLVRDNDREENLALGVELTSSNVGATSYNNSPRLQRARSLDTAPVRKPSHIRKPVVSAVDDTAPIRKHSVVSSGTGNNRAHNGSSPSLMRYSPVLRSSQSSEASSQVYEVSL